MIQPGLKGRDTHEVFMRECFALAERGQGTVSPNPLVGALLVKKGRIVAKGWHRRFGGAHAEVDCLERAHGDLREATLYVNLEPCAHYGKTPPCTDALIARRVGTVVIAMRDPNRIVAGGGIRKLRQAGIRVVTGVLQDEARRLNKFFVKHVTTGIPYVHVKIAQSIDGYIGGPGSPRWISSPPSLRRVHLWRSQYDAVLIGAGTVRDDDPFITVRHVKGRHPHVVILDGRLSLKDSAALLRISHDRYVFLCVDRAYASRQRAKIRRLEDRGVIVLQFAGRRGRFRLLDVLREIYRYGVGSVLVEGGSTVFAQCRDERIADEVSVFVAPFPLGGGIQAYAGPVPPRGVDTRAIETRVSFLGRDVLFHTHYVKGG